MFNGEIYGANQIMFIERDYGMREILRDIAEKLRDAGLENAKREAEWLVMAAGGRTRLDLLTGTDAEMDSRDRAKLDAMVARRLGREPLQYIVGEAAFYGRTFVVSPDVLIPRPETEELVERVLALPRDLLTSGVLDLGTGSGCIPITVACEREDVPCTGVEISSGALDIARLNADRLGAAIRWVHADMADENLSGMLEPVSVLVSNPPYVPDSEANELQPEVHDHEPHLALFSGADPLRFYRVIASQASKLLHSGGCLLVEIHFGGGADVCRLFEEAELLDVTLHTDLSGKDRIVQAWMP